MPKDSTKQLPAKPANSLKPYSKLVSHLLPLKQWDQTKTDRKKDGTVIKVLNDEFELVPKIVHLGKSPVDVGWTKETYKAKFKPAEHLASGKNVGFRVGPNWVVLDVDPRNMGQQDTLKKLELDCDFDHQDFPTVRTGSGGYHVYMRLPDGQSVQEHLPGYEGLEFKSGYGRQVVTAGSKHPETGKRYVWDPDTPDLYDAEPIPDSVLKLTRKKPRPAKWAEVQRPVFDTSRDDSAVEPCPKIAKILDTVPDIADYPDWCAVIQAIHYESCGSLAAMKACKDWSWAGCEADVENIWFGSTMDRSEFVTFGTLNHLCEEHGGEIAKFNSARKEYHPPGLEFDAEGYDEDGLDEETVKRFNALNKTHKSVIEGGKHRILRKRPSLIYPGTHEWESVAPDQLKSHGRGDKITRRGKQESFFQAWLDWPKIAKFDGVTFDPSRIGPAKGNFNLFDGWAYEPDPNGKWDLLEELIYTIFREDAVADYYLDWTANMFQNPQDPAGVGIVLHGIPGTGKSTLLDIKAKLTGRHGLVATDPKHIISKFNKLMRDKVLVGLEEPRGENFSLHTGVLKSMVTSPTLSSESKGLDAEIVLNMSHIFINSNSEFVIPIEKNDRRWMIQRAGEKYAEDHDFFSKLDAQMDNGGLEGFLHHLLNRDLSAYTPFGSYPKTKALAEQKLQNLDPFDRFWYEILDEGIFPGNNPDIGDPRWEPEGEYYFDIGADGKQYVVEAYRDFTARWAREKRYGGTAAPLLGKTGLFQALKAHGVSSVSSKWRISALEQCRRNFNAVTGTNAFEEVSD